MIDEGKVIEASNRKAEIAEESMLTAARELRDAARLALPVSPSRALVHFKRATDLDPTDLWSWIELGRLRAVYDTLDSAELSFKNGLQNVTNDRDRAVLHNEFGNLLIVRGQLALARTEYESALAIAAALAKRDSSNSQWLRDLSISHNKLGDVEVAAGNLGAARTCFESSLTIAEALAKQEPRNSEWQRDLWASHGKLGQLAAAEGDAALALTHYYAAETVMAALVKQWPDHPGFSRDLETVHGVIAALDDGDVEDGLGGDPADT